MTQNTLAPLGNALPTFLNTPTEATEFDSIGAGVQVPTISVRQNGITLNIGGEKVQSTPIASLQGVVVAASAVGRVFYKGTYDPRAEEHTPPDCKSYDGVKPDADVANPQSTDCKTCPMGVKGSSTTMAGASACRYACNLAVVIPQYPDVAFRLRIPATSIFSREVVEGFTGFNNYVANLRSQNKVQPFQVVTEIKHNLLSAYVQPIFKAVDYVRDQALYERILQHRKDPDLDYVLGKRYDDSGAPVADHNGLGTMPTHITPAPQVQQVQVVEVTPPVATPAPQQTYQAPVPAVTTPPAPRTEHNLPYEPTEYVAEEVTYWKKDNQCIKVDVDVFLPDDLEWTEIREDEYNAWLQQNQPAPEKKQRKRKVATPPSAPEQQQAQVIADVTTANAQPAVDVDAMFAPASEHDFQ